MKRLFISLVFLAVLAVVSAWTVQAPALEGLQVLELMGRLLGPDHKALAEYDYLEPGKRYRLMPDAAVEFSSLDGTKFYLAQGPGILTFEASGRVAVNGKPIKTRAAAQGLAGLSTKAGAAAGTKMAAVSMRGQGGISVTAKTADGGSKSIRLYSGYYALVIGCGAYSQGWPPLPNPVRDAHQVAELLRSLGWQVREVTNPSGQELRKAFYSLVTGPGRDPDKAILVWFSGHGHTLKEADGSRLGYIVPVDAPDPATDEMGFMEKAMSMRRVETVARRVMSKHVLMMFDSCFSGALFTITRAKPSAFIEEKVAKPVRQFVTAGNENEEVPDKSHFKTVFLQGLGEGYADRNQDGYITGQELGAYLQEKVVNYSRKAQHPQYGKINNPKLDKGDFVFAMKSKAQPAPPPQIETRTASLPRSANSAQQPAVPVREEPQVDPAIRRAVIARIEQWSRDAVNLDARAMIGNLTPNANIAVKLKGTKINTDRAEYMNILRMQARRFKGQFSRRIIKVMGLEVMGSKAEATLKTKVVGPGGGAILIERLSLKERNGVWKISRYRFNKLGEVKPVQQAVEEPGSKEQPGPGASNMDPEVRRAVLKTVRTWSDRLAAYDHAGLREMITADATLDRHSLARGHVKVGRDRFVWLITTASRSPVQRRILEVLSTKSSGETAEVVLRVELTGPVGHYIRRETMNLTRRDGVWKVSKFHYEILKDLDAADQASSGVGQFNRIH